MIGVDYVADLVVGVTTFPDGKNDISFAAKNGVEQLTSFELANPSLSNAIDVTSNDIAEKLSLTDHGVTIKPRRPLILPVYHCGGTRQTSISLATITASANRALSALGGDENGLEMDSFVKEVSYAEWRALTFPTTAANSYSLSSSQKVRTESEILVASRNPLFPLKHYFPLHGFPAQLDRFGDDGEEFDEVISNAQLTPDPLATNSSTTVGSGTTETPREFTISKPIPTSHAIATTRKNNHNSCEFARQFNLIHKELPIRVQPSNVDDSLASFFRELLQEQKEKQLSENNECDAMTS
jgi:hypothetical protein